jgi:hypothetical protein
MVKTKEFNDRAARNYIREKLNNDKLFSCLPAPAVENGRIFAFVPEIDRKVESAEDFGWGGLVDYDSAVEVRSQVIALIQRFLSATPNAIAVFLGTPVQVGGIPRCTESIGVFTNKPSRMGIWKQGDLDNRLPAISVYLFLLTANRDTASIEHLMRLAWDHTSLGMLTILPDGTDVASGAEVDGDFLRRLADQARYVFVGAFDEEAKLILELPRT